MSALNTEFTLRAEPLTRAAFSAFGEVIETDGAAHFEMNGGALERYYDLANIEIGADAPDVKVVLSIATPNKITPIPHAFKLIERHPLGSQAFIPLGNIQMYVVVAAPTEHVQLRDLRAFKTNGLQGVNYKPGVWHLPLIIQNINDRFLIVDRGGSGHNCDELVLSQSVRLL